VSAEKVRVIAARWRLVRLLQRQLSPHLSKERLVRGLRHTNNNNKNDR
jgi:hypothetical protein